MATIDDVVALGYEVEPVLPQPGNAADSWLVRGYGLQLYVRADDQAALTSLADPDAHANRVYQFENPTYRAL